MKKLAILIPVLFLVLSSIAQDAASTRPLSPYCKARMANGTLYIAGQIARNPETNQIIIDDIQEATRQCMRNIEAILKEYQLKSSNLVMVQIFLMDLNDYGAVNEAYREFFEDGIFPARICLQIAKIPGGSDIEISAIAVVNTD